MRDPDGRAGGLHSPVRGWQVLHGRHLRFQSVVHSGAHRSLKAVPTAVLLASLPESDKEAGSQRGIKALEALAHYFGRVQALWKPVATEEAFEIVRRRLFAYDQRQAGRRGGLPGLCRLLRCQRGDFPQETQESRYFERLMHAYPIHPEVFDRLYEDWSSLDNFQRTRGVLKLMAKVIHRLWKDGNNDLMIHAGQPAALRRGCPQ